MFLSQHHEDHSPSKRFVCKCWKKKAGPNYGVEFTASSALSKGFKNHYSLDNVEMNGESASADVKAAKEFLGTQEKLIGEENYLLEQIFDMDETSVLETDA